MKCLIVYYSMSGNTKRVAEKLSRVLNCDLEEITELKRRRGTLGFIKSVYEILGKKFPPILELERDPHAYDTIIVGTPVWVGSLATPVKSFLERYGARIDRAAFFLTKGGEAETKAFAQMSEILGMKPVATMQIRAGELKRDVDLSDRCARYIENFARSVG
jgi:flavodoxin